MGRLSSNAWSNDSNLIQKHMITLDWFFKSDNKREIDESKEKLRKLGFIGV
jgi:hypothetical protein